MISKTTGKWHVDLANFTCHNTETKMIITFEKKGKSLRGKIKEIPLSLLENWVKDPNCNKLIRKAVIEADEVFFKAYFNNEIEKKCADAELIA